MAYNSKPSIRIDWFDGSVIEDAKPPSTSQFADEEDIVPETERKPAQTERKPIGFKRLLDISFMEPDLLTLEVTHRPGFWNLFDQVELKGDYLVLIVKSLSALYRGFPKSTTKLAGLLETRFLSSDFLEKVTDYVNILPNVRIVDKRMNALLWDDVDSFFVQIVDLCDLCISYYSKSKIKETLFKRIEKLLKVLHESANGVIKEHSETIREDVFERIAFLQKELEKNNGLASQIIVSKSELLDSYKNLNIYPTKHDLILGEPNLACKPIVMPNIKYGAYLSVEHYLDVQFKLLREDYFAQLREGICKYLKDPSKRRHENIRVYTRVRVLGTYVSNNKVGHLIDLAWEERSNNLPVKNKQLIKQLMFGSLLLFTSDEFHTILCATVLDSSFDLLRERYLAVSFQNPVSRNILSESFLMVESEVFFEPYHRVLKVLQDSTLDSLPMQKYIVYVKPEAQPPAYLTNETLYTIEAPDKTEIPFPVLDTNQWPIEEFGLDNSQLEAFKFALTREFAVIQGPPGTGKTFIGIKIASTLLKNLSLEGTPMLIICYTNHALDQFLEGILGVTDSVIRLGSQSKNEKLERYNLNSVRAKIKCKYSYLYSSKRGELEKIYKEIVDLQTEIEKCEQGIICYKHIKPHLKIDGKEYDLKDSDEDRVLNWLFGSENDNNISQKQNDIEDSWENIDNLDVKDDKIETCFTEKWALNEMESLRNIIKHVDINKESFSNPDAVRKFETEIVKIKKRFDMFKNKMASYKNHKVYNKINKVKDLYGLSVEERWQLYFSIVREIQNELLTKMDGLLIKHNIANEELEEMSTLIDSEVIRTARVVGVTTTAAARRHQLIKKMKSPIVIVEEASEVLEAHIVASLTHECQHLILIGDHQQLRPTVAHFALTKHHNFDVSLFERMIRNGIHARTLSTQRRMRPNFAALLVPEIYKRLDSHATVMSYPDVKGMRDNLYFVSHEVFEDSEGVDDSWSHQNTFEAEWCISLAQYLIGNGYTPQDITILSTYNGQVSLIKKISYKSESLRDIKITAVDNFQGEESRIVILSLVRSNRDGKIGFISDLHRICVALSRAKEGFYIFGNIKMLSHASPMWMVIYKKLIAQKAIGEEIYAITPEGKEVIAVRRPALNRI